MTSRYDHLNKEELLRLLEARDQRDATRFGLVWEANEIEREKARNNDFDGRSWILISPIRAGFLKMPLN